MENKIPTEILIIILNNLQSLHSTQDLYSSLLVNRFWCKVTIPILWELTFGQECCEKDKKSKEKALCIRTYISCMDTQARTLLTQNGVNLSSSPPQATFDYPSFTHKFIINNLVYFNSIYSQQIISLDQNNSNSDDADEEINKSRILLRELCKLIINHCTFLDCFKLTSFSENYLNYNDLIISILELPDASKVFKKLESMKLFLYSDPQTELLTKLINVQKRLEYLSIGASNGFKQPHSLLLWAIIGQKETLKSLRLKSINFCGFKVKSSPIGQFISLQELSFEECSGLRESDCLLLASSFTQLSSFQLKHKCTKYPRKFIIKILQTANTNLRTIGLYSYSTITFDTFSTILNYCTKITKLSLQNLSSEQVIAIFNNNFSELRSFSFGCEKGLDANELLCQMAKNVPESLETIKIRMKYKDPWIFSADSLRIFFEGWCCKREENKKLSLHIRQTGRTQLSPLTLKTMGDEHFKVIGEYGIQFDMVK